MLTQEQKTALAQAVQILSGQINALVVDVSAPAPSPAPAPVPAPSPPAPAPSPAPVPGSYVKQRETVTNYVTVALTGTRTFNINSDADAETVPWGTLQAGDVVNIFYKSVPYKFKFGIRAVGTQTSPVIINGVTNSAGLRPVLDFAGAKTPSNQSNVFTNTPEYGESLGGIVIKRGPNDDYFNYKPRWIKIQNLELRGARNGATYTRFNGSSAGYQSSGAIYISQGADIVLENLIMTDSGFGLFVMAKDGTLQHAGERIILRGSRVYGNGVSNSWLEHNVYMQASNPIVEGNYIGQLRTNAPGSSYKSRSSGEVFRDNYVVAAARALDFVHSEDNTQGIQAQPDYGIDYVYNNTIVSSGPEAIHFGGDNYGEQDSGPLFNPGIPYRRTLYFWNNVVNLNAGSNWRTNLFDLSLRDTTANVWNNTFNLSGGNSGGEYSWLQFAGQLRLAQNTVNGKTLANARSDANPTMYSVSTLSPIPTTPYN